MKNLQNKLKRTTSERESFTITDIQQAFKNPNRVNIFVDGVFKLSLDIFQVTDLKIKIGMLLTAQDLLDLEQQSEFGKIYARALEYCLVRPRSEKEVRDYLWKKTLNKKLRKQKTGEIYEKKGVSLESVEQTMARLREKQYIDDEKFARFWVENRRQRQGSSLRKLKAELAQKGVSSQIQELVLAESGRNDSDELQKIIAKKAKCYTDQQKLMRYLISQGFAYEQVKLALEQLKQTD